LAAVLDGMNRAQAARTLLERRVVHIHDIQADPDYTLDVAQSRLGQQHVGEGDCGLSLHGADVDEHVPPALIRLNEAVALCLIEPFPLSSRYRDFLLIESASARSWEP
jgi:hypothetical protein